MCRLELINFLEENKLSQAVTDFDATWTSQIKRKISKQALEDKLTAYFQGVVKIFLPKEILKLCETPHQLIEYVGYTDTLIRLPACDRNEMLIKTNRKLKKKSTPLHYHLHNFIMSRIPSDMYRIFNPSLGIEKNLDTGELYISEKKSKRLTEVSKFDHLKEKSLGAEDQSNQNIVKSSDIQETFNQIKLFENIGTESFTGFMDMPESPTKI